MSLSTFLESRYLPSRIEFAAGYAEALRITIKKFSRFIGRDALLLDLNEETIARFLTEYRSHWSARSTNNRRSHLITLWIAAFDAGRIDRMPVTRRIKKLKESHDPPMAWRTNQIASLLAYCSSLQGTFANIPQSEWWSALFDTIYWTGCRIRAMLATSADCYVRGEGVLVRKQKNKKPQWYPLPRSCCQLLDATEPWTRDVLFPYPKRPKTIFTDVRRIIEAAGLDCPRHKGLGLFHRVRRTTISYCAAVDPAIAQRQAGHSSYATTLQSYVDPRIATQRSAADVLPDPLAEEPLYESSQPRFRIYG